MNSLGPGGGTVDPLIRQNVPPGEDASVWNTEYPHGSPEHTDADLYRHERDGRVTHDRDQRVHIPTDPRQNPW